MPRPRAILRTLPLAMALTLAGVLPAQAGSDWLKTIDRPGESQGLAAAPKGGIYVGDHPTLTGSNTTISRYSATGGEVWATTLGTGGLYIRGMASDPSGNVYVALYRSSATVDGYAYQLQQVKPDGTLGWSQTWYDADASLTGDVVATRSGIVYVAERDASTAATEIRRFATADGDPKESWTLSGPKAPADRPTQLIVAAPGTFLLDRSGVLLRLKADGTIQWRKTVGGVTDRGSMGVDASGVSVSYDADFMDLQVRRLSLAGATLWNKPLPGPGTSRMTATSAAGETFTIGAVYRNDIVKGQMLIAHLDSKGKVVGKVFVGTPDIDSAGFALPVGDHLFVAGYRWRNNPIIARVKKP